jgi:hypothetical protein
VPARATAGRPPWPPALIHKVPECDAHPAFGDFCLAGNSSGVNSPPSDNRDLMLGCQRPIHLKIRQKADRSRLVLESLHSSGGGMTETQSLVMQMGRSGAFP